MNNRRKKDWMILPNIHTILLLALFMTVLSVIQFPRSYKEIVTLNTEERVEPSTLVIPEPKVDAAAYVVIDIKENKKIFGQNDHTALPLASLTKLMTTLAASRIFAPETKINAQNTFAHSESLIGSTLNFRDFARYVLTVSSNVGAATIANSAGIALQKSGEGFLERMNAVGESIGLEETYFLNESGLDDSEALNGGYGSAFDVARLLVTAQKEIPDILSNTSKPESDFQVDSGAWVHAQNTNLAIRDIPGLIAGKTGFTNIAGGNLAILFDADIGHPVAIIVLGSGKEGRFEDVAALVQSALRTIHNR